jgi:hypothetical protein
MYKKIISLIAVSALFFGATVMAHTIAKKRHESGFGFDA